MPGPFQSANSPTAAVRHGARLPSLSAAAFDLPLTNQAPDSQKGIAIWGQGDMSGLNGTLSRQGLRYNGSSYGGHLGLDVHAGSKALAGISFMHNQASVDYAVEGVQGVFTHTLRSVHPYVYLQPTSRFSVWAIGGFGEGEGRLNEPGHDDTFGTSFRMVSGGSRAVLSQRGSRELGIRADAFSVQLGANEPISGASDAASGEASRARVMLELVLDKHISESNSVSFKAEFGGRVDGGDAFEGFGTEAGVRLGLLNARSGFDIALFGRTLVTHVSDYRDWGVGVQASWDPGRKDRGLRLSVAPTRGQDLAGRTTLRGSNSVSGDTHMRRHLSGLHEQNRLESGAAYGWDVLGRRGLVTAFTRVRLARLGRELRMGTEFSRLSPQAASLPLKTGFEVSRRSVGRGRLVNAALVRISIPF